MITLMHVTRFCASSVLFCTCMQAALNAAARSADKHDN